MSRTRALFTIELPVWLMAFILSFLITSCGDSEDTEKPAACTNELVAGVELEVRDAVTDMPIAENAIATLTSGSYQEIMTVTAWEGNDASSAYLLSGAYERPGTYDISLSLTGYESWAKNEVEVDGGICHVSTVRFTVRLNSLTI